MGVEKKRSMMKRNSKQKYFVVKRLGGRGNEFSPSNVGKESVGKGKMPPNNHIDEVEKK